MQQILLLHGALGSRQQLEPVAKQLQKHFIVHQLNFSGHSNTAMPQQFSIPNFAKDVLFYLEQNRIENINVFGYSMGGYVALYLALHNPEKVKSIFILATKFSWTPAFAVNEVKQLNPAKIAEKVPAFAQHLQQIHQPNNWQEVVEKTAEMMMNLGNEPAFKIEQLQQIQCRVQVAVGDKDTMVSIEETVDLFRNLPNAFLQILPNTKHAIEKVNAVHLADAINNFIDTQ